MLGMLTRDDVNKLADLARIQLTDEEKDKLQKDMESILGYISELQKAPSSASATAGKAGLAESHEKSNYSLLNVMREDGDENESGSFTEDILSGAPKRKGDFFVVKKILDN